MTDTLTREPGKIADYPELPQSHRVHWSRQRKEDVVRAVRDRLIAFDEARWKYLLSRSEFQSWQDELASKGAKDLIFELADVEKRRQAEGK
jgi:hypothetical protein